MPRCSLRLAARIALGLVLAATVAGAAGAWQVGNWVGRTVLTESGALAGCRMSVAYDTGVTLHVLRLSKGALLIGMSEPGWSLEPKGTYSIGLIVDGRFVRRARGVVLDGMRNALFLDLGRDGAARAQLRDGQSLSLADGMRTYDFRLTSIAEALARLESCVRDGA